MAFIHCLILNIVNQCPIAGHVPINSENRPILRLKSAGHCGIDTLKGPKQCRSNTGAVGFVPGLYLVYTWSIPGLYLVCTWLVRGHYKVMVPSRGCWGTVAVAELEKCATVTCAWKRAIPTKKRSGCRRRRGRRGVAADRGADGAGGSLLSRGARW